MTASLNGHATAFVDAVRALERTLSEARGHWDDSARRSFDRRYGDPVVADGKQTSNEMKRLAQELASAVKTLDGLW